MTMQQGPGEVLVHMKLAFTPTLTIEEACRVINEFEAELREARARGALGVRRARYRPADEPPGMR